MPPDDAPVAIRTARGEYRLWVRHYSYLRRRPWVVTLHEVEPNAESPTGLHWDQVVYWRCQTEADARRVARNLDVWVREGVIE